MVEVLTNFRCTNQAYYVAVMLLDKYFKMKETEVRVDDLHLTGVVCMLIASKVEDIYPLKLKVIFEKIAHKKFPIDDMKEVESQILSTTGFDVRNPTVLDFMEIYLNRTLDMISQNNRSMGKLFSHEKSKGDTIETVGSDYIQHSVGSNEKADVSPDNEHLPSIKRSAETGSSNGNTPE